MVKFSRKLAETGVELEKKYSIALTEMWLMWKN